MSGFEEIRFSGCLENARHLSRYSGQRYACADNAIPRVLDETGASDIPAVLWILIRPLRACASSTPVVHEYLTLAEATKRIKTRQLHPRE